jgi:hypothetical protein
VSTASSRARSLVSARVISAICIEGSAFGSTS